MEESNEKMAEKSFSEESESEEGVKEAANEQTDTEKVAKEPEQEEATEDAKAEEGDESMDTETQEESEEAEGDAVEEEAELAAEEKNEALEEKTPESSSKIEVSRWETILNFLTNNSSTQFNPQSSRQGHLTATEVEDKIWQRQDRGDHAWKNQVQALSFLWGREGRNYKDIVKEVSNMLILSSLMNCMPFELYFYNFILRKVFWV